MSKQYTLVFDYKSVSGISYYQILTPNGSGWGESLPKEEALKVLTKLNKEENNE